MNNAISKYMSEQGRKGGAARNKSLTPKQRSAIARLGGLAKGKKGEKK